MRMSTAQSSASLVSGSLDVIDLDDRIRLFDPTGAIRQTLRDIWTVLEPMIDDVIEESLPYYLSTKEFANIYTPEQIHILKPVIRQYQQSHYTDFLSSEWSQLAASLGDGALQLNIPVRVMLATANMVNHCILKSLAPHIQQHEVRAATWPFAIQVCAIAQAELATTRVHVRNKKAELKRMDEQSSAFQNDVLAVVHGINDATAAAKSRTSDMEKLGHAMLQRSAEVSAAASQSASSMNEAARTSVTLATEIGRALEDVRESSSAFDAALIQVNSHIGNATHLETSSNQIASIVDLIRQVAQRTNLLALNATIEAARAGEAGRGFSVVAQEVKSLASQTTTATNDIAKRIAELQMASGETVRSYAEISKIVYGLQQSASALARRMDQHGSLLDVITGHVTETARTAESTSGNIEAVSESAQLVARQLSEMRESHAALEVQMTSLRHATDGFLQKLSA